MAGFIRVRLSNFLATANQIKPSLEAPCKRFISGKAFRLENSAVGKQTPYPYKTKKYGYLQRLFDRTTSRFHENTKLLVVDGPIASGKSTFAKQLAEDLDMLYYPEANLDMIYINDYGFDMRTLDSKIPEACRSFDVKDFCADPKNRLAASFQIITYSVRYAQYIDALAHILSTGQGVILDRSVYSDFVFLEAMFSQGYVSRGARSAYYEIKKNTIGELMRPHLAIYLDVPVAQVQENIKKRNIPYEITSKVFTTEYLNAMERHYKETYLKEISAHSEILVYDWSNGGDVEVVIEDIERIDFNKYTKDEEKMRDWRQDNEEEWAFARHTYADRKDELMFYMNVPRFDVPELVNEAADIKMARDVWQEAPGERFIKGFNETEGDSGLLFKTKIEKRRTLPLRERIIPAC